MLVDVLVQDILVVEDIAVVEILVEDILVMEDFRIVEGILMAADIGEQERIQRGAATDELDRYRLRRKVCISISHN